MVRHRPLIVYLVACLIALGSTLRYLWYFVAHPSRWAIFGLLAAFYALFAAVPWLYRRSRPCVHLYLAVQTCILGGLALVTTIEDAVALPFLSLILLAMVVLPPRIGLRWIGLFTVLMVGSMIAYGIMFHGMDTGMVLLTALVYVASYLGFGTLMAVLSQLEIARNEAEEAHKESEELLAELQIAEVMVRGRYHSRADLDLMLDAVAKDYEVAETTQPIVRIAFPVVVALLLVALVWFIVRWYNASSAAC